MSDLARHRLALLVAAFLFSTGGTVIKLSSWSGFQVAGGRSAVAALVLFACVPAWRRVWEPRALLVGVAYGATLTLFAVANKLTTAANAIFLQSTAPLYVLFLAPWLLGERNRRGDVALTSLILGGLLLFFVGSEEPLRTAPRPLLGDTVAVAAGVTWACTIVGLRWMARPRKGRDGPDGSGGPEDAGSAGAAVIAGNAIAFVACLPFFGDVPAFSVRDVGAVVYLGVFQIGLAYVFMNRGIAGVPALEAAMLLLLEPVLSIFIAAWVHGELPGPWDLAGCAVILATTATRTLLAARRLPSSGRDPAPDPTARGSGPG